MWHWISCYSENILTELHLSNIWLYSTQQRLYIYLLLITKLNLKKNRISTRLFLTTFWCLGLYCDLHNHQKGSLVKNKNNSEIAVAFNKQEILKKEVKCYWPAQYTCDFQNEPFCTIVLLCAAQFNVFTADLHFTTMCFTCFMLSWVFTHISGKHWSLLSLYLPQLSQLCIFIQCW